LKTLRDQNLYPSIVADFYEMDGLDDLKRAEQKSEEDADDGKLARIPANEKAILKKKYVMYEKWKDLYGSEVQRKLRDLKSQLKNVERSIEQTEKWLEPYVRDIVMINQEDTESLTDKIDFYPAIRGTATMRRDIEFICYRPMENDGETMTVVEDESEATHYRVIVINSTHVNLSGAEQPNSPAQGPSAAVITYYPAIVCRHVFNNIFRKKMEKNKNRFRDLLKDYTGDFDNEYGEEVKQARVNKNWSVRKLRTEIGDHLGEEVPIELSSYIRRLEDGLDDPQELVDDFGEEYLDAIEEVLGVELGGSAADPDMYEGIGKTLREFTGQVDPYVLPENANPLGDLLAEIKFSYYYDYKLGLGLYTMK
jgi:ribosome-binding protein aMBF1 (putative translation factor)